MLFLFERVQNRALRSRVKKKKNSIRNTCAISRLSPALVSFVALAALGRLDSCGNDLFCALVA